MATHLIRGFYSKNGPRNGCVLTIGNFDGVHLGHQELIKRVNIRAHALGVPSVAMIFEPQPSEYFLPNRKLPRLTRFREKWAALADTQLDYVYVLKFNAWLASLSAEDFIQQVLHDQLHVKQVMVGGDFRFGKGREGDIHTLQKAGEQLGFAVEIMSDLIIDTERVSSTRIRQALLDNQIELAHTLLGRPYTMMGKVVYGDQLGRQLGFPTANILLHRVATPVHGIYVVKVHGLDHHPLPGVASVGTRPTVGGNRIVLEVYLFDFDRDIYGKMVQVEFCVKLREEENYDSLEALKSQIEKDAEAARRYFRTTLT